MRHVWITGAGRGIGAANQADIFVHQPMCLVAVPEQVADLADSVAKFPGKVGITR